MPIKLVAWGGPVPILTMFLIIFWHRLKVLQKLTLVVVVYVISIFTGILADVVWRVGNDLSAVIAGIGAPLVYGVLFAAITLRRQATAASAVQEPHRSPEPTAKEPLAPARQWDPIIIAAIIQAVASIIVALITVLAQ